METPDINFIRHRKFTLRILFNIKPSVRETFQQLGIVVSGAALMSAIAGYGALMVGRSVPVALALGTLGSVGGAMKARLKDS